MSAPTDPQRPSRGQVAAAWLLGFNSRFARAVANLSWWRILAIFVVVLIAANVIGDTLGLEHDAAPTTAKGSGHKENVRIESSDKGESVVITIGGREVVRIQDDLPTRSGSAGRTSRPAEEQGPAPSGPPATDTAAGEGQANGAAQAPSRITLRGLMGDFGTILVTLLLAYLVAAKIIVRKVDESDAKVKTAVDVATRETVERQLAQARLQVMQAQVEPHFLFNTLAAVDYLIETAPARASQMQKALIRYLRGALPQMREASSNLGRELRLVQAYLEVMKMRIEDRLTLAYDVPDGLHSAEFPPMVLQSLVENAIKHGIEPKQAGGALTVAAGVTDGALWVEVRDTGVGLQDHGVLERPTQGSGIGLANIRERLAMLYPGKSRLSLHSDEHSGTTVRIVIPYQVGTSGMGEAGNKWGLDTR